MKTLSASLVCLLFVSVLPLRVAEGQTVHSVFGDRHANTTDDLLKAISTYPYTWETPDGKSTVVFKMDGTGKQGTLGFTWSVKGPQEAELVMAGGAAKATLKFSDNYESYFGADFEGHSLHGSVVLPATPTPTAAPMVAATPKPAGTPVSGLAGTPAAGSNPFMTSSTDGASTNDALEQAIVNSTYTWEPEGDKPKTITFKANGVGQNTFFPIT